MGYDAFGLPAEQYAIEHGVHPAVSTEQNIANFRRQLDNIGFSFDWSREVRTSDPGYYRWTQWIFLQLFNSWYNRRSKMTEPVHGLLKKFETEGNSAHPVPDATFRLPGLNQNTFTAEQWRGFDEATRQTILMEYRIAYCGYGEVNWCEPLGTVLANDEVVNGVSERGGYPVVKKKLRQWYLRITEYADRLLEGLQTVDFSEAMKEMQTNWIGKSSGAEIDFAVAGFDQAIRVYTTRPDTIFGVDFMVLAPEHELVETITTPAQKTAVDDYLTYVKSRSERERMAEKKISGVATGGYVKHPFTGQPVPVWISEYVLAGYGTGAIMAVPSGDERDHKFAKHFEKDGITITNIFGEAYTGEEAVTYKDVTLHNSGFLDGLKPAEAAEIVIQKLENEGTGTRKVNYKMRDAAFSRQRYWGEPFPIIWKDGIAYPLEESELPLELPYVETYKPGPEGEGPLANIPEWTARYLETNTMPGYAGSSWYFIRYMDPHNSETFCDKNVSSYWNQVDLYVGGTEHAVGHLLYSRMWTKALYDLGFITFDEPFKKLLNQGMIQGSSRFIYHVSFVKKEVGSDEKRGAHTNPILLSYRWHKAFLDKEISGSDLLRMLYQQSAELRKYKIEELIWSLEYPVHIDVNIVNGVELDIKALVSSRAEYKDAVFYLENGNLLTGEMALQGIYAGDYICGTEVEKMSKSKYNTVNPDMLVDKYGADTFRMYEMFLGPVEMSKPWDTKGIEGVHRFLKKLWRLFYNENNWIVKSEKASPQELKVLHKTIKKIEEDTERFSFNTAVSAFMVCVNELTDLKCSKQEILEPLVILLTPYAPHIAEELYHQLRASSPTGGDQEVASILDAAFPNWEEAHLVESSKDYPVSINGKMRTQIPIALNAPQLEVEALVLANEVVQRWMEGKPVKKFIFVPGKMVNVVV
jgi:leucyl-tRNA synthetase